ncbi:hypothetical protein VZT92_015567 [Zoarces viviparus]|uniref:Uncharacterized protein n=1 Tax=Zoarces viviparus TaxID=48416 RepID=A0AAW1EX95_ZOAVI
MVLMMGALLIRPEPSEEPVVAHKTQAAELRSLEELSGVWVTQVSRPAISFPATKRDNQSIKRQSNF